MESEWQNHRDWELLPDLQPQQQPQHLWFSDRLAQVWRSLVDRGIQAFSDSEQTEHLERCWLLAAPQGQPTNLFNIGHLLWLNLRPALSSQWTSEEPEIRQVLDGAGAQGWTVANPKTGQKIYLQSEDEVRVWLEERFYS